MQLIDLSIKYLGEIIEDLLVKAYKFIYPANFVILDIVEEDRKISLILGRPYLANYLALNDIQKMQLMLGLNDEYVKFTIFSAIKYPTESDSCLRIDVADETVGETFTLEHSQDRS